MIEKKKKSFCWCTGIKASLIARESYMHKTFATKVLQPNFDFYTKPNANVQANDCFFYVLNQTGRHFLSRFNILDKPLGISDIMLHNMDSHLFLYYVKCHHWTVFYLMVEYFVPSIVSLYLLYIVLIVFEWSMNLVLWQTKQSSVSFRFQIVYTCNVIILRRMRD